ncbi:MAG: ATP-dependent dsDNA exonuclease, partial [Moraxellaceae bacterium]
QQSVQHIAQLEKAKAEHHRWNKISSLIGDAKGATFKKLAQQFHLQMLVDLANQQLVALTPRYELRCIEDSLGLTIVDHFMNDEVRPVLSLSGGESFLVSLALALGIANMASGTTKLESLFIDEGFGTLDQSSLHVVMDALDRLQSQGRKVILISHVADMHERIPVKIQVIPQGSGASRIEVVG